MRNKSVKKWVSSVVIACLLFSSFGVAFVAAAPSATTDIKGHWAEGQISAWIDKGLIKGYEDGSFKPENKITRAEFIALINRSFGFTEQAAISFSDVKEGNWAYAEVAKAVKAAYITGYSDGTIGASKPISRQEAAAIVDRLLGLSKTESAATAFTDSSSIALWAKGSVDAAVAKGILKGYAEDNSFKPSKSITRAEAVVTLDRAVAAKATAYNAAGTYGPATGTETINGNVVINVPGVILQNLVINGDLLFAEGIGSGDATLNGVTVNGKTRVEGGGENSIHLNNSILLTITVNKKTGTVRIVAEGSTTVGEVTIQSPTTVQETGTTGSGFSKIILSELLPANSKVTLKGSFDSLIVKSTKIQVEIPEGSVKEVTVEASAAGMTLNLGADAKIVSLILDAVAKLIGTGTIDKAILSSVAKAGTTFEKQPTVKEDKGTGTPAPTTAPTAAPGAPAVGPTNPDPVATPPAAQKGTVTGSVYKYSHSEEQIVGATVSVYSGVEGSGSLVSSIATDNNGAYRIGNVPVGNFYLIFAMPGYVSLTVTPTNHTVSADLTNEVPVALMYHNVVKGKVTDTIGEPISGINVKLYDSSNGYANSSYTSADGSYSFYDVPASETVSVKIVVDNLGRDTFDGIDFSISSVSAEEIKVVDTIKLKSRNKQLKALSLSGITLSPEFNPNILNYYVNVPFSVNSTKATAIPMHVNATAVAAGGLELLDTALNVGDNTIQIYVNSESRDYYYIYHVYIHRALETSEEAQIRAIARIEAANDSATANSITIADLNLATGLNTAIAGNLPGYKVAIVAAAVGALDTSGKIAQLVASVNTKIGDAIDELNNAEDAAEMKSILEANNNLYLNLTAYNSLANDAERLLVAATMFNNKTSLHYIDITRLQEEFNEAVLIKKGTVSGYIYSNSDEDPIDGASVSVYSGIEGSGTLVGTAASNNEGAYTIGDVPVGNFYLKFVKTGYLDLIVTPEYHIVYEDAETSVDNVYMYHNMVKGFVTNTINEPISGINVKLYDDSGDTDFDQNVNTSADGSYSFYDVPASETVSVKIVVDNLGLDTYEGTDSPIGSVSIEGTKVVSAIKLLSRNKQLKALSLSGIETSLEFDPNIFHYDVNVPFNVTSTKAIATPMYVNSTFSRELTTKQLFVGENTIDIYVHSESDNNYYYQYNIKITRESGTDEEAQTNAIAKIEAANDSVSADLITAADLNAAIGSNSANEGNEPAYKLAIIAAAVGALDTSGKIAQLVASVNTLINAAINELNSVENAVQMQSILEANHNLYLNLTVYNTLTDADKEHVANIMFNYLSNLHEDDDEYYNLEDIQDDFNYAVNSMFF